MNRRSFLTAAASASTLALASPALALNRPDVIIGWTTWSDAEVTTKLAARVLRNQGFDVELALADIEAQFRTVSEGAIDMMMMSWEPGLHAPYLRRYGDNLTDLGTIYEGSIGLAVPEWVTDVNSITDLPGSGIDTIVGIDPGAGLMATTREAISAYNLDMTLSEGTGPKMVRALAKAQRGKDPIVVTAWRPHAKFGMFNMRYLEDPQGLYADKSEIHARANSGFVSKRPDIARIVENMTMDVNAIESIMVNARQVGVDDAVNAWMSENEETITSWL
jgi:glycine betaine/proline transport system substrate-binding protein